MEVLLYRSSFELVLHCHNLSILLNKKMDENVWENILLKKICSQKSFMSYVLLACIKFYEDQNYTCQHKYSKYIYIWTLSSRVIY